MKSSYHHHHLSLGFQIVIGLIIGIVLGYFFNGNKPFIAFANGLGTIFINLISMIVLPIVITCLTVGIANLGDIKKLGRIGLKTIIYFEMLSTIAFIIGLIVSNFAHLGTMIDLSKLKAADISQYVHAAKTTHGGFGALLLSVVPKNIFTAMSTDKMLPVIFFCVFFGLGTAAIGERGQIIIDFLNAVSAVMFKIANWIMHFAPFGVAGLMGATVAEMGIGTLKPLLLFIAMAYAVMVGFILIVLGITSRLFGFKITEQLRAVKNELVLAFTTASSEVTLPGLMQKTQNLGISESIASFVIPTGYTFNLDGSALYQSLAAIFIAQAYHIHLSLIQQLTLLVVLMVASKGMAGVPGASFIVLMTSLGTAGIPAAGVALIAGIDRLVDMGRTVVNVIGNVTATLVIGKSEHEFSQEKHDRYIKTLDAKS